MLSLSSQRNVDWEFCFFTYQRKVSMRGNSYLLLALCLCFVALLKATPVLEANDDVAQKVISALNNALNFYHRDFRSINLDGIFGLRVAQGKLV